MKFRVYRMGRRSLAHSIALMVLALAGHAAGETGQEPVAVTTVDVAVAADSASSAAAAAAPARETIVIRADHAWEVPEDDKILHFKGNFELHSPDWSLRADEADLYGPLDDPDRIVARGVPATVTIRDSDETVIGHGLTVEYERTTDTLTLRERAELEGESIAMSSAVIVFDVASKRLKSSGESGVEMILQRDAR